MFRVLIGIMWLKAGLGTALGQVPAAAIHGSVRDTSGAVIVGASVTVRHPGTGLTRQATTEADGTFRVEALEPGTYEIAVSSPRFETAADGDNSGGDNLTVSSSGVKAERRSSERLWGESTEFKWTAGAGGNLPLNGRSFLNFCSSTWYPRLRYQSRWTWNNYQQVLVGGAYFSQTRISIDGSTVGDRFVGGTTQGLSQESVQEFQASTFNLDLATGLTGSGAINIVTRRGSNELHGSAFFYYRDHNLAAYPGLRRSAFNPEPSFARRQSGFNLGGPLRRDRLFWFANYEHNNQMRFRRYKQPSDFFKFD
jgi:hypothetical protein